MTELLELIDIQRKNNENILIEDNSDESKIAVVYCSSNAVYAPDTPEAFKRKIMDKDRYEWYALRMDIPAKHIFIRDVGKNFYREGINDNVNSLEKLAERLKKETEGYKVRLLGSSSGGYASIALGLMLGAEYVMSFSGQFWPFVMSDGSSFLNKKYKDYDYINLRENVKNSNMPIFYMMPTKSPCDIPQYELVKDCPNVHTCAIISNAHGVCVNKTTVRKIIDSPYEKLLKIYSFPLEHPINEFVLVKKFFGKRMLVKRLFDYVKKYPLFFLRKDFYEMISGK